MSGTSIIAKFSMPLRVHNKKTFFLFLNQNIPVCCGYSKNRLNETILFRTQNICYTDGLENIYNYTLKKCVYRAFFAHKHSVLQEDS